jgi:pantoate--beta-alanine ligase
MASIFVNPTQFSAGEDLDKYPRTLDSDLQKLTAAGVDFVFVPEPKEMYARWPTSTEQLCHVEPKSFATIEEGKARPEFFRGVATVVTKLFNIATPDVAYFGQKDISQCILICNLVKDLNMPVQVNVMETIRDTKDGLALSSRNAYLTSEERAVAGVLYKALSAGKELIENSHPTMHVEALNKTEVVAEVIKVLKSQPLVTKIEYVSVASHHDMKELEDHEHHAKVPVTAEHGAVISAAIRLGNVRLIDNVLVGKANELLYKVK